MLIKPFERHFHAVQTGNKPFEPVWNGVRIGLKLLERIDNGVQLGLRPFERISSGVKLSFQHDFRNGSDPATASRKSCRSVHLLELGHYRSAGYGLRRARSDAPYLEVHRQVHGKGPGRL
ncbi:MAG: hypothetical protein AAB676_10815 [Verrucomicrobiota bacterium]